MIKTVQDIQDLVLQNETDWQKYGEVNVKEQDGLLIFNYSKIAQYENRWNYFERVSRGLILDAKTGEVVARPFKKFLNYGQNGTFPSYKIHMVSITEKLDGSMGILYRKDGYKIATRGSLQSDQAIWATEFLNENYDLAGLPEEYTLIFEIIYPDNRIVVDYGDREDLVLLAVIDRFTGFELPFFPSGDNHFLNPDGVDDSVYTMGQQYGFTLPQVYDFNNPHDILSWCGKIQGVEDEGVVVRYSDGSRLKFKGDDYSDLHRRISNLTFKNTFEAYVEGKLEDYLEAIPDEFYKMVDIWIVQIEAEVEYLDEYVKARYVGLPKKTRKEFAQSIQQSKYSGLWFNLYDNAEEKYYKTLYKMVYEKMKKENEKDV